VWRHYMPWCTPDSINDSRIMSTKQDESTAFDPSRRKLCPDGSCIGLIGSDGKCTVCGTLGASGSGETPAAGPPALPTPEPEREIYGEAGSEATSSAIASNAEEGFDPNAGSALTMPVSA